MFSEQGSVSQKFMLSEYKKAREEYRLAEGISSSIGALLQFSVHYQCFLASVKMGDFPAALVSCKKALVFRKDAEGMMPESVSALWYFYAHALAIRGCYRQAFKCFDWLRDRVSELGEGRWDASLLQRINSYKAIYRQTFYFQVRGMVQFSLKKFKLQKGDFLSNLMLRILDDLNAFMTDKHFLGGEYLERAVADDLLLAEISLMRAQVYRSMGDTVQRVIALECLGNRLVSIDQDQLLKRDKEFHQSCQEAMDDLAKIRVKREKNRLKRKNQKAKKKAKASENSGSVAPSDEKGDVGGKQDASSGDQTQVSQGGAAASTTTSSSATEGVSDASSRRSSGASSVGQTEGPLGVVDITIADTPRPAEPTLPAQDSNQASVAQPEEVDELADPMQQPQRKDGSSRRRAAATPVVLPYSYRTALFKGMKRRTTTLPSKSAVVEDPTTTVVSAPAEPVLPAQDLEEQQAVEVVEKKAASADQVQVPQEESAENECDADSASECCGCINSICGFNCDC